MKLLFSLINIFCIIKFVRLQNVTDPLITLWVKSSGFATSGSASGILTNVLTIGYDTNYVYIHSTGVPSYRYFFKEIINLSFIDEFCFINF